MRDFVLLHSQNLLRTAIVETLMFVVRALGAESIKLHGFLVPVSFHASHLTHDYWSPVFCFMHAYRMVEWKKIVESISEK